MEPLTDTGLHSDFSWGTGTTRWKVFFILPFTKWHCDSLSSVEPSHHPSLSYLSLRPRPHPPPHPLLSVSQKSNSRLKGTTWWPSSLSGEHSVLIIQTFFMLHFYGNLLVFIGVIIFFFLFNYVFDYWSLCVCVKHSLSAFFRSTGASFKKEKR